MLLPPDIYQNQQLLSDYLMSLLVSSQDLSKAIAEVVKTLPCIDELYTRQQELLQALFADNNIFYTGSTNSGKTLPAVMFPNVLKQLNLMGYKFPDAPKVLFITPLNSLQPSLMNNTKALGLSCEVLTSRNANALLLSEVPVIFVSPEVMKLPLVTNLLLTH